MCGSLDLMRFLARLLVVAVLAAFAASAVAHAAGSAAMASEMASPVGSVLSDAGAMEMSGCDACGDAEAGKEGIGCSFVCASGGFALVLPPFAHSTILPAPATTASTVTQHLHGLSRTPDQQPPRLLI
jgi:hypothetical protein